MTGAIDVQLARRRVLTTWSSHRLASLLVLAVGAMLLLLGGFALATHFRGQTSPPPQLEVPMPTSPGAGP